MRVSNRSSAGESDEIGVGRERAQFAGGFVGIAAHRQEAFDQGAGLARQPRAGAERRLLQKAFGDLGHGAAADGSDAGDREQIGDEMMRRLRIGAGKRREHAAVFGRAVGRRQRQLIEIVRQRPLPVEILDQAPLPGRRQVERGDEGGKQADIADADFRRRQPVERRRLEPERQHFGVGRRLVLAPEGFDAGLQDFGGRAFAMPKHDAQIAIARDLAGRGRFQVGARHRDGEVRAAGTIRGPSGSLVRNMRRRMSSPDKSRNGSAGCSTGGSTGV